jgi:hypothetical protein
MTPHTPGPGPSPCCCPACTPGPGDAPLQGAEQQLLCAGELECLLQRQRGVVMVQLCAGWDTSGAAQPVDNPLVVYQLQQVLERPDLSIFMSQAPGGCRQAAWWGVRAWAWAACVQGRRILMVAMNGGDCQVYVLCEV